MFREPSALITILSVRDTVREKSSAPVVILLLVLVDTSGHPIDSLDDIRLLNPVTLVLLLQKATGGVRLTIHASMDGYIKTQGIAYRLAERYTCMRGKEFQSRAYFGLERRLATWRIQGVHLRIVFYGHHRPPTSNLCISNYFKVRTEELAR